MALPADLTVSPGPAPDLEELTRFLRAVTEAQEGRPSYTRDFVEALMAMPGIDPLDDMVLVRDSTGALVAVSWLMHPEPGVRISLRGFVAPERTGEGIGSHLLSRAIDRARALVPNAPDGTRVTVAAVAFPEHEPSMRLLTDHGFAVDRYFLEMRLALDVPPPPPVLGAGIRLRHYDPDQDLEALYDAVQDAFRDHFGYTEEPREQGLARFRALRDMPTWDPTLSWLAMDGHEIAGNIICFPDQDGDDTVGYVANLGVRPPWRGRGLAKALLRTAFTEFYERGKQTASLHVDAASLTGATRLYESVGMRETERHASLERELRSGEDLVVR